MEREVDQDPSNLARLLLTERFPRLGSPGPVLQRILERFFPQLLVPVQAAKREDSTWAMYYGFDQYLWHPGGDTKRGIGIFFNFGATDGEANPIKYSYSMGVGGKGVIPGRPHDTFGIGWAAPSSAMTSCHSCASSSGSASSGRTPSRSSTTPPSPRG